MEQRAVGVVAIIVKDRPAAHRVNEVLSDWDGKVVVVGRADELSKEFTKEKETDDAHLPINK